MKDHSRRSFVKTSAATGLTFTFAGLIRAHGQSGGGTTWNPEVTFGSTFGTDVTTWPLESTYASTTRNHEATYVATTCPGSYHTTTWDSLATATTAPEYATSSPEYTTTARPPQVGDIQWFLYVKKDPTDEETEDASDQYATNLEKLKLHNNGSKRRKFWFRKVVPYDGGEMSLMSEVVSECYVQAVIGSDGVIPDEDLHRTIDVSKGKARIMAHEGDKDYIYVRLSLEAWSDNNLNSEKSDRNTKCKDKVKAYTVTSIKGASLSINSETGKVTYSPSQILPDTLEEAFSRGLRSTDYILAGISAITPRFIVSVDAGVGEQNNIAYTAGLNFGANYKQGETTIGASASLTVQWSQSDINSPNAMQWVIHRAKKTCIEIDTNGKPVWGPAYDADEAVVSNEVSVETKILGNPPNLIP